VVQYSFARCHFIVHGVSAGMRIDSADGFLFALRQDRINAIPSAFALFLLVATMPRPKLSRRMLLAILFGLAFWFMGWKFLDYCNSEQLRLRGIDPEKILRQPSDSRE
jgi:hypothetical protein